MPWGRQYISVLGLKLKKFGKPWANALLWNLTTHPEPECFYWKASKAVNGRKLFIVAIVMCVIDRWIVPPHTRTDTQSTMEIHKEKEKPAVDLPSGRAARNHKNTRHRRSKCVHSHAYGDANRAVCAYVCVSVWICVHMSIESFHEKGISIQWWWWWWGGSF